MDGSGGGRPKAKKTPPQTSGSGRDKPAAKDSPPAEKSTEAAGDSDDPFAIGQAPGAAKAIPCAPKPRKGRLTKVVCPMCETPGFIPKAALGRQVKCANKECLVPVFTAQTEDQKSNPRVPTRIAEKEEEQRKPAGPSESSRNPLLLYGIAGGILLLLTVGLVWWLNQEGPTELGAVDIPMPSGTVEDDEPETQTDNRQEAAADPRAQALAVVDAMIRTARSNENDQKPLTRRQTGDAYLRLGLPDKAAGEFQQMKVVAERQNVAFYPIVPYVHQYWQAVVDGRSDNAAGYLSKATALKESIPAVAGVAVESAISLAAALAHAGQTDEARALLDRQRLDRTIDAQQDSVRASAWWSLAEERWLQKMTSPPLYSVFTWYDPLSAAVAGHLAVHEQWSAATKWASAMESPRAATDAFAAVATTMLERNADAAARQQLLSAAEANSPHTGFLTAAILSRDPQDAAAWQKTQTALNGLKPPAPAAFGSIVQTIEADRPDLTQSFLTARPLAAAAAAAAAKNQPEVAAQALNSMVQVLSSTVPPSPDVREKALEIDRDSGGVKDRIADELSVSGNRITTRFIAYRKSIDRYARAAEDRRIYLLQLLSHVIQSGGVEAVRTALTRQDSLLAREVFVDPLSGQLYIAALDSGLQLPEALQIPSELVVPLGRLRSNDQPLEHRVIPPTAAALQQYQKSPTTRALNALDQVAAYPGLRSVIVARETERLASAAEQPGTLLRALLDLRNQIWRQQNIQVAATVLANRDKLKSMRQAVEQLPLSPSQRVAALHQIVRGYTTAAAAAANAQD